MRFNRVFFLVIVNVVFVTCENKSKNNLHLLTPLLLQENSLVLSTKPIIYKAFANVVKEAPGNTGQGFKNSNLAVNGVRGGGKNAGSTDVYSLGTTEATGFIVLEWSDRKVTNGNGIDFVVYENPFLYGNNPNTVFMEQIIVEVSRDGIHYCGFHPQYVHTNPSTYSNNPNDWVRFAGKSPVLFHEENNRLSESDLFNLDLAGGDGFDLDDLSEDNTFNIGCSMALRDEIVSQGFIYIRLVNTFTRKNPITGNTFLKDSGSFDGAPDIDGVAARYLSSR